MIVNRVELRNFVSHRQTSLDFGPGITAIVGPNGAGKTSLLDAISFALFNLHSRGVQDHLINRASESASVRLWFTARGRHYLVERELERRGARRARRAEARLYEVLEGSKRLIAEGVEAVLKEVEGIVGVDRTLFEQAIYVKQGEIEELVKEASKRKGVISKLLGIDDLHSAWELMKSVIDSEEAKLEAIERELDVLKKQQEELARVRARLAEVTKEAEEGEGRLRRASERASYLKALLSRYEELGRSSRKLELELSVQASKLEGVHEEAKRLEEELALVSRLEEELAKLRPISERYEAVRTRLAELAADEARLSNCKRLVQRLERELEERKGALGRVEEELRREAEKVAGLIGVEGLALDEAWLREAAARVEERLAQLREERDRARREAEELAGEVAERERLLKELAENPYECPVCEREMDQGLYSNVVAKVREGLEGLAARLSEARRREREVEEGLEALSKISLDRLRKLIEAAREGWRRAEAEEAELGACLREAEELEERVRGLGGLREELDKLEEGHRRYLEVQGALRARPSKEELVARLSSAKRAAEELSARVELLRREREALGYSEEAYARIKRDYEEADGELRELMKRHAGLESEKKYLEERVRALEEGAARLREREAERRERARLIELLRAIRESFGKDGVQRLVRARAKPIIEHYMKEYLSKFDLEYSDVRLDEDFNPVLLGQGGEQPIDSISGGERVAAALALRLAIAKAVAEERLELMILDEPTIHLDEVRRRELVEIFKRFFKEGPALPQLIVVTHDREVEEAADQVFYVAREGGFSKVVRGEQGAAAQEGEGAWS